VPAGLTAADVTASIGASYAITYVIGTLGIIAVVSLFPRMIGLNLAEESRRLDADAESDASEPLQARAYRVENEEFCRPSLGELSERLWDRMSIVRIRRGLDWLKISPTAHLPVGGESYGYGFPRTVRVGIARRVPRSASSMIRCRGTRRRGGAQGRGRGRSSSSTSPAPAGWSCTG
jgi:uncharacterized transporter YbjL